MDAEEAGRKNIETNLKSDMYGKLQNQMPNKRKLLRGEHDG
jgi:hypothetical protein